MKKISFFMVLLLVLSCSSKKEIPSEKLTVVTTIFPLKDIAENIGGDKIDVINLLPSGASPHTFEPTPKQIKELRDAEICIRIGLDADFWLDKIITSAGSRNLTVVTAGNLVELIKSEEEEDHDTHEHEHGEYNPHIWLDPLNAVEISKKISEALGEKLPAEKDYFRKNLKNYIFQLEKLDSEIRERVSGFSRKEFIAMHSAWIYFAKRYGLIQAGEITESPGKEPTPQYVSDLIKTIRELNTKAIFAEYQLNPKLAESIAKETGIKVLKLDPLGDEDSTDRNSYIKLIKYNVKILEEGLK